MRESDAAAWNLIQTGTLTANLDTGHITRNGQPAGHYGADGYCRIKITTAGKRHTINAHRIVWMVAHGPIPDGLLIGHRNGRTWDNRPSNLQLMAQPTALRHIENVRRNHDINIDAWTQAPDGDWPSPHAPSIQRRPTPSRT